MSRSYANQSLQKITISEKGKYRQIAIENITHIKCEGYISFIYFHSTETIISVCRSLKDFEQQLKEHYFLRVHRNCVVNLWYVEMLDTKSRTISLQNQIKLRVSRRRYPEIIKHLTVRQ